MTNKTSQEILADIRARQGQQTQSSAGILADIRARGAAPLKNKSGNLTLDKLKKIFDGDIQKQKDIDDFDRAMDVIH